MEVFLIFAIIFNTLFASCYKIAANKQCNLQVVNLWLYIGSTLTIVVYVFIKGDITLQPVVLLMGIAAGFLAYFSTLSFFHHMKQGQLSASWTVISLSIGFPVFASIFFWQELPTVKQSIGLVLIVIALVLFGRKETISRRTSA